MFFANEQREKVREENPGISFGKTCFTLIILAFCHMDISNARCRPGWQDAWREVEGPERR